MLNSGIKISAIIIASFACGWGSYSIIKGSLEHTIDFKRLDAIAMAAIVGAGIGAGGTALALESVFKSQKSKAIDALIDDLTKVMTDVSSDTSKKLFDAVDALASDRCLNGKNKQ